MKTGIDPAEAKIERAKSECRNVIAANTEGLLGLSHAVHSRPETAWEEFHSVETVASALAADSRFSMTGSPGGIKTAFLATTGSGPLHLGICAEYDALPGIGHACGHNIIAASAVGVGLALAPLVDELGITLTIFGTPAEEGGGGKIDMLKAGLFDSVHCAMMVHPAPHEADRMHCLAVSPFDVHFHGKTAHASAFPQDGINAADAITVAQVALGLLRQHIRPTDRIHGIVTKGGDAPNIVPEHTIYSAYIRSKTLAELEDLRPRTDAIFQAAALATGCSHEIVLHSDAYSEFLDDEDTLSLYRQNAIELGRAFPAQQRPRPALQPHEGVDAISASTDMANVSLKLPSIHPMLGIDAKGAGNHQPGFTQACVTPSADKAVLDGAAAMAMTCVDLALRSGQRERLLSKVWPK